jgi:hypothetical protein
MAEVPAYVVKRFRSSSARPRVTHMYLVSSGWVSVKGKPLFSTSVGVDLLEGGATLVRLRWRGRQHDLPLSRSRLFGADTIADSDETIGNSADKIDGSIQRMDDAGQVSLTPSASNNVEAPIVPNVLRRAS